MYTDNITSSLRITNKKVIVARCKSVYTRDQINALIDTHDIENVHTEFRDWFIHNVFSIFSENITYLYNKILRYLMN